jgi:hypothetical protein
VLVATRFRKRRRAEDPMEGRHGNGPASAGSGTEPERSGHTLNARPRAGEDGVLGFYRDTPGDVVKTAKAAERQGQGGSAQPIRR